MKLDAKIPEGALSDKWTQHKFNLKLVNPANKRNGINDQTYKMIMDLCEQIENQNVLDMDKLGLLKENN